VIDAHHHCWQLGQHDCTWPTADLMAIYRDVGLEEFVPLARAAGVTGSILIQSQTSDADTDYLLSLADQNDFIKGVVGWVDLASASAPARIAHLAQHPKLCGLRPMLQAIPADDWILSSHLAPAIEAMITHKLCFDALVTVRHLAPLYLFARRYPQLPLVIDHAAKPDIASASTQAFTSWQASIGRLASLPQVYCKLSGLMTEAGANQGEKELRPYIEQLYLLFGAERLIWGSDWPVLSLAPNKSLADYEVWLKTVLNVLPVISEQEQSAIFGGSSLRFYQFS
jgi:L-fuconolactonase